MVVDLIEGFVHQGESIGAQFHVQHVLMMIMMIMMIMIMLMIIIVFLWRSKTS